MCHPDEAFVEKAAKPSPPELPPTIVTPPKNIATKPTTSTQPRKLEAHAPARQPEKKVEAQPAPEKVRANTRAQLNQTLRGALEALMATERDETLPQRDQSLVDFATKREAFEKRALAVLDQFGVAHNEDAVRGALTRNGASHSQANRLVPHFLRKKRKSRTRE